ncbi:MAG: oxygen-insensitive NAD(P)H nitroreductase [Clostridia bacterium]
MNIIKILQNRYTTKLFDPQKKITDEDMQKVKEILNLSASSLNLQPWKFVIAQSEGAKQKLMKATDGMFAQNQTKILNSSAVVIFSSKLSLDDEYLAYICDCEEKSGRFKDEAAKQNYYNARCNYRNMHSDKFDDIKRWTAKQAYLNLGNFLVSTASLGIDSCTMEGLDMEIINEEFDLTQKGYTACFAVAIGYRSEDDFNDISRCPKSRLEIDEIIELV